MAKETKKSSNPYAGKSRTELVKELTKLEAEYEQSRAKGKMAAMFTPELRRQRSQLLTALNQTA